MIETFSARTFSAHTSNATTFFALLTGFVFCIEPAAAVCTIPAASFASGDTTVCNGTFTNEGFNFNGSVVNGTIINNGVWEETGALADILGAAVIGPDSGPNINYTGLSITNNGSITWNNATADAIPVLERTMSVVGSYFTSLTEGGLTYINNGTIKGSAGTTSLVSLSGMATTTLTGSQYSENAGLIEISGVQLTNSNAYVSGMAAFGGAHTTMLNTATGNIAVNVGIRTGAGMDYSYYYTFSDFVTGVVEMENRGEVHASGTTGEVYGMALFVIDHPATPHLTSATMTNSGLIEVNSAAASGFYVSSNNANVPVRIFNSGLVDSNHYSLQAASSSVAPVYFQNTGRMVGDIATSLGDDRGEIWGSVAGSINLALGSDRLQFYSGADISQITLFDGGDDIYAADGHIDAIAFNGGMFGINSALLQNWETVLLTGGVAVDFTGAALLVGGGDDSGGNPLGLIVSSGSTMTQSASAFTVTGDLRNAGVVSLANGTPDTTLIVAVDPLAPVGASGNYVGLGGTLRVDTELGDDASPSDRLVIDGGTGSGSSLLAVNNVGGGGALTQLNGILVVDAINGATTVPGLFTLSAPVVAGPYEYSLYRGSVDATNPDAWYLRSEINCTLAPGHPLCGPDTPDYRPETSLYAAVPAMTLLYGRLMLDTLHERRGTAVSAYAEGAPNAAWARVIGQHGDRDGGKRGIYGAGPKYDYDFWAFQGGMDLYRDGDVGTSRNHAGAFFAIGHGSGDVDHIGDGKAGENSFMAYSWGAYWTHYTPDNAYIDTLLMGSWYDVDAKSNRIPKMKTDGGAFGASVEGGYPVYTGPGGFSIEPQAQLVYQTINLNNGSDVAAQVHFDNVNSLVGRVGVRFAQDFGTPTWLTGAPSTFTAWVRPNFWYEFLGDPKTKFSSATGFVPFAADMGGTTFEINTGFSTDIGDGTAIYANASYLVGIGEHADGNAYDGKLGVKVAW